MKKYFLITILLVLSVSSFSQNNIIELPETATTETYNGDVVYKRHIPINFAAGSNLSFDINLTSIKTITSMYIFSPLVTSQTQGKMELIVNITNDVKFYKYVNSALTIKTISLMYNSTNHYLRFTYNNTYYDSFNGRYCIMIFYTKA